MKTLHYRKPAPFTVCFEVFSEGAKIRNNTGKHFVCFKLFQVKAPNHLFAYNEASKKMDSELKNYYRGCKYELVVNRQVNVK